MVNIQHATKYFNRSTAGEVRALNDVSLDIKQGEFTILLGSNGSGKSTLLNAISGVYPLDTGVIKIDGHDVTALPEHSRTRWISRVFQNPLSGTAAELSIVENFRIASLRTRPKTLRTGTGTAFHKEVAKRVRLLDLGLENKLEAPMGSLSGGQRQSLTLLMAVMDETKLLLMDEPASALDPRTADLIMKTASGVISRFNLTAILITHQLRDALTYGDRVILMSEGSIKQDISGNEKKALTAETLYNWF